MMVVLGTALWGWSIDRDRAFELADNFVRLGGRWFDTASNYPIDNEASHFGLAESWLAEWIKARKQVDVRVIRKIGSIRNDGSSACDLSTDALQRELERSEALFGEAFHVFCIHWDDRVDAAAIARTVTFLDAVSASGRDIGLSGIKRPDLYAATMSAQAQRCWVQIKHNVLSCSAYSSYSPFHGNSRFLAYGANAGGLKVGVPYNVQSSATVRGARLDQDIRPYLKLLDRWRVDPLLPKTFNQLNLAYLTMVPDIKGVIIGPSQLQQLAESYDFIKALQDATTLQHIRYHSSEILRISNVEPKVFL